MPFDKDMKIALVIYSLLSIAMLVAILYIFTSMVSRIEGGDLTVLYFLAGGIIVALAIIVVVSLVFLRRNAAKESEHRLSASAPSAQGRTVTIPYNKNGLYALIAVSIYCIVVVGVCIYTMASSSILVKLPLVGMLIFPFIVLLGAVYVVCRRIRAPGSTTIKACPRCGSSDVVEVMYSWWGGFFALLSHEVHCKSCGKVYNGVTGGSIVAVTKWDVIIIAAIIVTVAVFILLLKIFV